MRKRLGLSIMAEALFRDRLDAGTQLAAKLSGYRGKDALVLGIPRGGVPVAATVARQLDADLDIMVARKLGAPGSRELAIGAVTANGGSFLNEHLIRELGVSAAYLEAVEVEQRAAAQRQETELRGPQRAIPATGRIVILVDDGLATGATMRAAVRSVRKPQTSRPARLVVAVPVGSPEACSALRQEADEFVCLAEPEPFWAVGLYYESFPATENTEVRQLLAEAASRRRAPHEQTG